MTMGSQQAQASFCTILDCGSPGLPADVCGMGNTCVRIDTDLSACLRVCADASECAAGLACVPTGTAGTNICVFGCNDNTECRATETCARNGACVAR